MTTKYSEEHQTLFALLALHFEFVPKESWIATSRNDTPNQESDLGRFLPSEVQLNGKQTMLINDLIDEWRCQPVGYPSLIRKYASPELHEQSLKIDFDDTVFEFTSLQMLKQQVDRFAAETATEIEGQTVDSVPAQEHGDSVNAESTRISESAANTADMTTDHNVDESPIPSTAVPDRFGNPARYQVLESLAEGGLGKVMVARDKQLGRNVAYKQIKSEYSGNLKNQQRFVFEAAVTGQLEHPGIVPVYSLGRDQDGQPYYAMRLIEGQSLHDVISAFHHPKNLASRNDGVPQRGKYHSLEFRQLLNRFLDLCNAIEFAHDRGVIHRDLKPSNVMVGSFGETFVVDWGLARHFKQPDESSFEESNSFDSFVATQTQRGSVVGTPAFMSPEQARGENDLLGPKSDIFSLGCMLYSLLTGQKAFPQKDSSSILSAVKSGSFIAPGERNRQIPRPLSQICLKAMSVHTTDRYSSAGELASDIERWLADEPVNAWKEPVAIKAGRWVRRHRTLVNTALALLVMTTIALFATSAILRDSNRKLQAANTKEREATEFAQQQYDAAIEANKKEKEAATFAKGQFDLALDAIGQYHSRVAQDFILGQSEFDELRSTLLQAPKQFYLRLNQSLQDYSRPSFEQRKSLMDSQVRLAALSEDLNDRDSEIREYNNALELCSSLRDEADSADLMIAQINILLGLSSAYLSEGKFDSAEDMARQADQLAKKVRAVENFREESLSRTMSRIYSQFASVYSVSGKPQEAIDYMKQAVERDRAIVESDPTDENNRKLAINLHLLSNVFSDVSDSKNAIASAEEAYDIFANLNQQETTNSQMIHEHAGNLTNLAYLYQEQNRFQDALKLYGKSESAYRLLVAKAPNIVAFRTGLASTLNNMGLLYVALKDRSNAESMYEQSIEIKERLSNDFPDSVEHSVSLGGGYVNFGGYFHSHEEYEKAVEWYSKGIVILSTLVEKHPSHAAGNHFLKNAHNNRFLAYRRLKDHVAALQDLEFVLKHTPADKVPTRLLTQQAQLFAFTGNHSKASETGLTLRKQATTDGDFYNTAFIHALAVTAAGADSKLNEVQRSKAVDTYTSRAIEDLKSMYETKALTREQFENLLETNPYLKPLHSHQLFKDYKANFDK